MSISEEFKDAEQQLMEKRLEFEDTFKEAVEQLGHIQHHQLDNVEIRNWEVEELINEYMNVMGTLPDKYGLYLMGSYVLADILKDPTPYKTKHQEYSIRTTWSEKITPTREYANKSEILDYLHSKYQLRLDNLSKVNSAPRELD